jgi:hypothetical protein
MSETKVLQHASRTMSKKEFIQHLKDIDEILSGPSDVDDWRLCTSAQQLRQLGDVCGDSYRLLR